VRLDHLLSRELVKDEPVVPALGHTASLNVDRAWRSGVKATPRSGLARRLAHSRLCAGHTRQTARGALLSFERPAGESLRWRPRRTLKTA
jgi:hypothetical protein